MRADQGPYRSWLFEQEWAREEGLVQEVTQSFVGPYTRYGPPIANDRPAPLAGAFESGAQTRALLDELGFSTREIEAFLDKEVVAQAGEDRES
jgi:crotonobetainyl-CoA:carnitine CoA-transferase CaiB-like acyl-CoA transferase